MLLTLCTIVFASDLDRFNHTSEMFNTSLMENSNITYYVNLPRYVYIDNSAMQFDININNSNLTYSKNIADLQTFIYRGPTDSVPRAIQYHNSNWSRVYTIFCYINGALQSWQKARPVNTLERIDHDSICYLDYYDNTHTTDMYMKYNNLSESDEFVYINNKSSLPNAISNYISNYTDVYNVTCINQTGSYYFEPGGNQTLYHIDINHNCTIDLISNTTYDFNYSSHIYNLTIEIGNIDSTKDIVKKGGGDIITYGMSTRLNELLNPCNCTMCYLNGNNCTIGFNFYSYTPGHYETRFIGLNYTPSASFITVNLNDSTTKNIINDVNITVQLIGGVYQNETTTDNGNITFRYNHTDATTDSIEVIAFSKDIDDYSVVRRNFTILQGINYTIDVLMTNTSDSTKTNTVTLHVEDEDKLSIEGAIIHILRRDPTTNTFLPLSDLTTNSNGEASFLFETDTVFYKFLVDYNGERVYTSSDVVSISSNDNDIFLRITTEDPYLDYFRTSIFSSVSIAYTNTSNASGYFSTTYSSNAIVSICTNISIVNITGTYHQEESCTSGTSGTITSSTFTPNNITLYSINAYINTNDGYGYVWVKGDSELIGLENFNPIGVETLLIVLFVIVICAFGFMASPIMGLIMLIVGFVIVFMTKLTLIKSTSLMILISLIIFTIITISKRE